MLDAWTKGMEGIYFHCGVEPPSSSFLMNQRTGATDLDYTHDQELP